MTRYSEYSVIVSHFFLLQLCQIVAFLGPLPEAMLQRAKRVTQFFKKLPIPEDNSGWILKTYEDMAQV